MLANCFGQPVFLSPNIAYFINAQLLDFLRSGKNICENAITSSTGNEFECYRTGETLFNLLHASARQDHIGLVKVFLGVLKQNLYPITFMNEKFGNLIINATKFSSLELVKICFETAKDLNLSPTWTRSKWNVPYTPLHASMVRGDYKIFHYLFQQYKHDASICRCLLHYCVYKSHFNDNTIVNNKIQIISEVLQHNKDIINEKDSDNGVALVGWRIHWQLAKYLLQLGANPLATNSSNQTVVQRLAICCTPIQFHELVELLIEKGFSYLNFFAMLNKFKISPLSHALQFTKILPETISLLCENIMDHPDAKSYLTRMLYDCVLGFQSLDVIRIFIEYGADPNTVYPNGQNLIHEAAKEGNDDAIKFLHSYGCNVDIQDNSGATPLHVVILEGKKNIHNTVETLINHGAGVNTVDNNGATALSLSLNMEDQWRLEERTIKLLKATGLA